MHLRLIRTWAPLALLFTGSLVAQPRAPRRSPALCVAGHHAITAQDPDVASVLGSIDAGAPMRMVLTDVGALVFLRTREGALTVVRLDPTLRSAVSQRVLSLPAGLFEVAYAPSGVGVAYVERGNEILFARLAPDGTARNVPRRLTTAAGAVGALALSRNQAGFALAWTTPESRGVSALVTDRLGVPSGGVRALGEGEHPSLAWLHEAASPVLLTHPSEGDGVATLLGPDGASGSSYRWPATVIGPVEFGGALYTLQPGAVMQRIPAPGPQVAEGVDRANLPVPVGFSVGSSHVAALLREARGDRLWVTLVTPDAPTPVPVAVRGVLSSTLSVRDDGAAVMLAREPGPHGASRLSLVSVTCAEPSR